MFCVLWFLPLFSLLCVGEETRNWGTIIFSVLTCSESSPWAEARLQRALWVLFTPGSRAHRLFIFQTLQKWAPCLTQSRCTIYDYWIKLNWILLWTQTSCCLILIMSLSNWPWAHNELLWFSKSLYLHSPNLSNATLLTEKLKCSRWDIGSEL